MPYVCCAVFVRLGCNLTIHIRAILPRYDKAQLLFRHHIPQSPARGHYRPNVRAAHTQVFPSHCTASWLFNKDVIVSTEPHDTSLPISVHKPIAQKRKKVAMLGIWIYTLEIWKGASSCICQESCSYIKWSTMFVNQWVSGAHNITCQGSNVSCMFNV